MKKMILLVCSLLLSWNASALNLAGIHLPGIVSAEAIIDQSRENRIVLHILRELTSEKLYGAFRKGNEANNDVLLAIGVQMQQMEQIFEAVEVVKKGNIIALDFQPDSGKIIVNGTERVVIAGTEFNRALLKVWLGKQPVQDNLK